MTHTLTVSIGRSVERSFTHPDGELCAESWADFKAFTLAAVERSTLVLFTGEGIGRWTDEATGETITEASWTVVAAARDLESIARLRHRLTTLAAVYRQNAIALTVGSTDLVPAASGEPF